MKLCYALDNNGDYELQIDNQDNINFICNNHADAQFFESFFEIAKIILNEEEVSQHREKIASGYRINKVNNFSYPLKIAVYLKKAENNLLYCAELESKDSEPKEEVKRKLSVSETRLIRYGWPVPDLLPQKNPPHNFITDLHTHFDAILPATILLRLAKEKQLSLKVSELKSRLQIEFELSVHDLDDRGFIEIGILERKYPDIYSNFSSQLAIPSGKITKFAVLESIYNVRDLITGRKDFFAPLLWLIAEYYASYKIEYIEISMHDIINRDWLDEALNVLPEIEKKYPIKIRFLVALYNYYNPNEIEATIHVIKQIAGCPYIVGIDYAGHEQYSVNEKGIIQHIHAIAEWISKHHPDFILRIHAGENALHINNVKYVLLIAKKFNVRMRIGHGVYGIDDFTLHLLQILGQNIIIEFNPDSNLALNNITDLAQLPLMKLYQSRINFVIGTDGPGFYSTTPYQVHTTLMQMGATDDILNFISECERNYVNFQEINFDEKKLKWSNQTFSIEPFPIEETKNQEAKLEVRHRLKAIEKKPIYIATNVRTPTAYTDLHYLDHVINYFKELLSIVDPKKASFVVNAIKNEITVVLQCLINEYNHQQIDSNNKFSLTYVAPNEFYDRMVDFNPVIVSNTLTDFPNIVSIFNEKDRMQHNGLVIFFGGDPITSDMIISLINENTNFILITDSIGIARNYAAQHKNSFSMTETKKLIDFLQQNFSYLLLNDKLLLEAKTFKSKQIVMQVLLDCLEQSYEQSSDWHFHSEKLKAIAPVLKSIKKIASGLNFDDGGKNLAALDDDLRKILIKLFCAAGNAYIQRFNYSKSEIFFGRAAKLFVHLEVRMDLLCTLTSMVFSLYNLRFHVYTNHTDQKALIGFFREIHNNFHTTRYLYGKNSFKDLIAMCELARFFNESPSYLKELIIFNPKSIAYGLFTKLAKISLDNFTDWQKIEFAQKFFEASASLKQVDASLGKFLLKQSEKIYTETRHPYQFNKFPLLFSALEILGESIKIPFPFKIPSKCVLEASVWQELEDFIRANITVDISKIFKNLTGCFHLLYGYYVDLYNKIQSVYDTYDSVSITFKRYFPIEVSNIVTEFKFTVLGLQALTNDIIHLAIRGHVGGSKNQSVIAYFNERLNIFHKKIFKLEKHINNISSFSAHANCYDRINFAYHQQSEDLNKILAQEELVRLDDKAQNRQLKTLEELHETVSRLSMNNLSALKYESDDNMVHADSPHYNLFKAIVKTISDLYVQKNRFWVVRCKQILQLKVRFLSPKNNQAIFHPEALASFIEVLNDDFDFVVNFLQMICSRYIKMGEALAKEIEPSYYFCEQIIFDLQNILDTEVKVNIYINSSFDILQIFSYLNVYSLSSENRFLLNNISKIEDYKLINIKGLKLSFFSTDDIFKKLNESHCFLANKAHNSEHYDSEKDNFCLKIISIYCSCLMLNSNKLYRDVADDFDKNLKLFVLRDLWSEEEICTQVRQLSISQELAEYPFDLADQVKEEIEKKYSNTLEPDLTTIEKRTQVAYARMMGLEWHKRSLAKDDLRERNRLKALEKTYGKENLAYRMDFTSLKKM